MTSNETKKLLMLSVIWRFLNVSTSYMLSNELKSYDIIKKWQYSKWFNPWSWHLFLLRLVSPTTIWQNHSNNSIVHFHDTYHMKAKLDGSSIHSKRRQTDFFFFAYHRQSYPLILFRNPLNRVLRVFNRIKYISYCQTLHCPMIPFIRWELAFSHSLTTIYILQCRVYAAYWVERI